MSDIAKKIAPPSDYTDTAVVMVTAGTLRKGAAEITRLRATLAARDAEVERLRAALKEVLNLPYGSEGYCRVIARRSIERRNI